MSMVTKFRRYIPGMRKEHQSSRNYPIRVRRLLSPHLPQDLGERIRLPLFQTRDRWQVEETNEVGRGLMGVGHIRNDRRSGACDMDWRSVGYLECGTYSKWRSAADHQTVGRISMSRP